MSQKNLPGEESIPFSEFKYYASLIFSYKQFPNRVRVAGDYDKAEAFFNGSLREHNARLVKMGFPPRELIFITDNYEINGKKYYRITAFLKPLLLKKPRKFTKEQKDTQAEYWKEVNQNQAGEAKDQPVKAVAARAAAPAAAAAEGGGGMVTPKDPKGPPVSREAITGADEEQNYN